MEEIIKGIEVLYNESFNRFLTFESVILIMFFNILIIAVVLQSKKIKEKLINEI